MFCFALKLKKVIPVITGVLIMFYSITANAAPIWNTDASGELTGSRTSPISEGIEATESWDNGGFVLSWNITENNDGSWTYQYTVDVGRKDVSHFILEISDSDTFNIYDGTDTGIEFPPREWAAGGSNPNMPNPIYGIKFDFGGPTAIYTIVTDRAPVYGAFYAKGGVDGDSHANVTAWNNALNYSDYKTNESFTITDFIVRPDSVAVPVPAAFFLLCTGLTGLICTRKIFS